ncbi:MAG: glycine--tRNA ligase [Bacilli bacterium]
MKKDMNNLVNFCKKYGFIYQGSEIYDGLANTWDYGPLGSILKNNIKNAWRHFYIQNNDNSYEVDASILMHPRVWEASGHISSFSDPLMDCKSCKMRHRADKMIEDFTNGDISGDSMSHDEMHSFIVDNKIVCPNCGKLDYTEIREFNLMFQTQRGVTKDSKNIVYLRPETAQGQFVNFQNVQRSMRCKIPFGIGQIGKAFRNEITPGNFTFRTIEFEQMEHQLFCKNGQDEEIYDFYKKYALDFLTSIGLKKENLRYKDHEKLAHYAKAACDIEYRFPFGFGEINGTHNRTDYDLSRHKEYSGQNLEYLDPITNEKFIPFVIESTFGADRLALAVLNEAFTVIEEGEETREILKLNPRLAPYKVAVLPLIKKYHSEKGEEVYKLFKKEFMSLYDDAGTIGKRYRRQDIIGTLYCITIDDNTLNDNIVTIRYRDTMKQISLPVKEAIKYIKENIEKY